MGAKRPRKELLTLLAEHKRALEVSCESYDRGNDWEAARLATTVFTLVHDGGSITSLLSQLGLRASLRFISSNRAVDDQNMIASPPLVIMQLSPSGAKFIPRLTNQSGSNGQRELQFQTWWADESVFKDSKANLSRRRLVFSLRHQDGGGHVGVLTDQAYTWLKAGAGWFGGFGVGPPEGMAGAVTATMRQVAWEVTETLKSLGEVT